MGTGRPHGLTLGVCSLSNVVQDVSGMDVVRAEAKESAEKRYPSFFSCARGEPRASR